MDQQVPLIILDGLHVFLDGQLLPRTPILGGQISEIRYIIVYTQIQCTWGKLEQRQILIDDVIGTYLKVLIKLQDSNTQVQWVNAAMNLNLKDL